MKRLLLALVAPLVSSPALALGPGQLERGFLDGANHHIGDASFIARFGRAPDASDSEKLRMQTHLRFMHDTLAARPATKPELAGRRAELLGFLDDYITRGITPHNNNLPYRNPVFVDDLGRICAVGYLIERSGRGDIVADVVAHERFDLLDDISADGMAEWVATSGFTPDELASIQPGYIAPMIEQWSTWSIADQRPADGPWSFTVEEVTTRGAWKNGKMQGPWTRTDAAGRVVGKGTFGAGKGTWTSLDQDGKVIATGPFADNHPHGAWTFFHASGNVAAEGRFTHGSRDGKWSFHYDQADHQVVASGRFALQRIVGTWKHFEADGTLLGETSDSAFRYSDGFHVLRTPADGAGVRRSVAAGNVAGDSFQLWAMTADKTTLYRDAYADEWRDEDGFVVVRQANGTWFKSGCAWTAAERKAAKSGDPLRVTKARLREGQADEQTTCIATRALSAERSAIYDRLSAHVPSTDDEVESTALIDMVGSHMNWYVEWPHVDGLFARVFETLADHYSPGTVPVEADEDGRVDKASGLAFTSPFL